MKNLTMFAVLIIFWPCSSWATLSWEDHEVAPYVGGSHINVQIEREPSTGTLGILDCSVGPGTCPIRYSQGYGDTWTTTTVTANSDGSDRWGLAFHPVTRMPYVSYQNGGSLILSHFDGSVWAAETVVSSEASGGSSLGFDPITGKPYIAYIGSGGVNLAWHDSSVWHTEPIDSGFGSFSSPSLSFDPADGSVCVGYAHTFNGIYFARRLAIGSWDVSLVESMSFPYFPILRFNPITGQPALAYEISMGAPVNYAAFNGSGWDTWQVSTDGHTCWDPLGLSYLPDGTPMVVYTAGSFSSIPVSKTSFHVAWMADGTFSTLSEHDYGAFNWNGPVDMLTEGNTVHVAYQATNIGVHLASAVIAEPPCELIPEEIASMEDSHSGGGVVSYEEKLYVWAGYTNYGPTHYNRTPKMEIYDPSTDTWSSGADIPQLKSSPACFELNGKFYTVGGETNPSGSFTNTVHRYDPDTDTWVQMNNFPRIIWQGQSAVCNGKAYVFGGATGYGNPLSSVYEYDEASDAWIPKAPMLTGVSYPAAVCFDNKIWVFGGVASFHPTPAVITQAIQVYDCATDTWEYCDGMPWKVIYSQAVVCNNHIWLFAHGVWDEDTGGWIPNEYAYKFSPGCASSGQWTRCAFTFTPPIKPGYDSKLGLIGGYAYFTDTRDTTADAGSERAFKVKICELALTVGVDIKPTSCPNPLNVKSKGVLPVAVLGTEEFDASNIDPASIRLKYGDDGEGVAPLRSSLEDVATPADGDECECTEDGPDGYTDLTLKFRTQEVVEELLDEYDDLEKGQMLSLELRAELSGGSVIEGSDCVKLVGNVPKWLEAKRWDGNEDGIVNLLDLAGLAEYWLQSTVE